MNLTIDPEFQALIPPMRESEREGLEESILADGCREALIVWNGVIVDGHNRYDICKRHGVEFRVIDRKFDSREAVKLWMIDNQVKHRRNLSDGARFDLIQTRKALLLEQGRKAQGHGETAPGKTVLPTVDKSVHNTRETIAKDLGWSTGKVAQADYVWSHADEETKKKVIADEVSINAAYQDLKSQQKRAEVAAIAAQPVREVDGTYDVIVIDPPWPMQKIERNCRPNQKAFDYPVMTEEQIAALTLPCADDCHVWVWTTQKFLPMALRCVSAWGLKYVCTFVWHKPGGPQPFNLPQYNCEFALYCRKGSPVFTDTKSFFTAFDASRTGHSEKPEAFYDVVRRVTAGRRLDMFNRRNIEGFEGWGNESMAA